MMLTQTVRSSSHRDRIRSNSGIRSTRYVLTQGTSAHTAQAVPGHSSHRSAVVLDQCRVPPADLHGRVHEYNCVSQLLERDCSEIAFEMIMLVQWAPCFHSGKVGILTVLVQRGEPSRAWLSLALDRVFAPSFRSNQGSLHQDQDRV